MSISPKNVSAQLKYKARGNPPGAHPESAVGNFFPGLEFNFLSAWRRILVGIELNESSTDVMAVDANAPSDVQKVLGFQLVGIDATIKDGQIVGGIPILAPIVGPDNGTPPVVRTLGVINLEWGNALAELHHDKGGTGERITCVFQHPDTGELLTLSLEVRKLFEPNSALISEVAVQPGELTQSLCSPWQTDFIGCACYYWAANRPDFVNVWSNADGTNGGGHNWLNSTRETQPDPETAQPRPFYTLEPTKELQHEDIMRTEDWEKKLRFVIGGKDES